jgi:hypothetical protein
MTYPYCELLYCSLQLVAADDEAKQLSLCELLSIQDILHNSIIRHAMWNNKILHMFKQNLLLFKQFIIDLPPEYLNWKISIHSDDTTLQMKK